MGSEYGFSKVCNPTAKKKHKCDLCGECIDIGEKYYRYTGIYDGRFFDNKYHPECITCINKYCRDVDCDEYTEDAVKDWAYGKVCANHECGSCPHNAPTRCNIVKKELELI